MQTQTWSSMKFHQQTKFAYVQCRSKLYTIHNIFQTHKQYIQTIPSSSSSNAYQITYYTWSFMTNLWYIFIFNKPHGIHDYSMTTTKMQLIIIMWPSLYLSQTHHTLKDAFLQSSTQPTKHIPHRTYMTSRIYNQYIKA